MIEDIRRAVNEQRGIIYRRSGGFLSSGQVNAMLRVEVDRLHEETLWEAARFDLELRETLLPHARGESEGSITIRGVALYFVNRLPAPGWRVINPMLAKNR